MNKRITKNFIVAFLIAAAVPLAVLGWHRLYNGVLERTAPFVEVAKPFRGIGALPVKLNIKLEDIGAGLDEVVIRATQKSKSREIHRQRFNGENAVDVEISFAGTASKFEPGKVELDILAFDKSYWSNRGSLKLNIDVDYKKPNLELLSSQHNIWQGGAQLLFYRVSDDNLAISGVKINQRTFIGYPAKLIDPTIDNQNIHGVIFAIDKHQPKEEFTLKVFAEDRVGNGASLNAAAKLFPRISNQRKLQLSESDETMTMNLVLANQGVLKKSYEVVGKKFDLAALTLTEQVPLLVDDLATISDIQIRSLLESVKTPLAWSLPFISSGGGAQLFFGDKVAITDINKNEVGRYNSRGYQALADKSTNVRAANDGTVVFAGNLGFYGNTVIINHGLGLSSLYGHLASTNVAEGDELKQGHIIGLAGASGFAIGGTPRYYFEFRIQGIATDPREWFDKNWIKDHIFGKIYDLKRNLGLPVPL